MSIEEFAAACFADWSMVRVKTGRRTWYTDLVGCVATSLNRCSILLIFLTIY